MLSISLVAEEVFTVGNFPVTNSLLTMWIGIVLVSLTVIVGMSRARLVPRGLQLILESIYTFFLNLCESVLEDKKQALRAVPFITTIFLFVFAANIFSIIPGVGSIGFYKGAHESTEQYIAHAAELPPADMPEAVDEAHENSAAVGAGHEGETFVPLFRPASADLNMTFALAIISVVVIQIVGFKSLGIGYLKKFFNFKSPITFFVGILELISEFAKIISFAFRLFGNIFAGEVLLTVMLMLVPYFVPIPFYGLELFVALIQAFVFAMLTLVFIKLAMISHAEEH